MTLGLERLSGLFFAPVMWLVGPMREGLIVPVTGSLCMLKVVAAHKTQNSQAVHRALWGRALPQLLFHPKMKDGKFKSYINTYIQTLSLMTCR